jgi:dolichyl-diphosphooligosaccharide--protein glycosyltransferase
LATTPEHALRTAVGFADHHAFDAVWLVVTLLGLVETERAAADDGDRALAGALVAIGVAGLVLSWEAGILLAAPVGLFVFARAAIAVVDTDTTVDAGRVLEVCTPVLVGTAAAAALTWAAHAALGWHSPFVAATPVVLFISATLVVAWFEVGGRLAVDGRLLAAGATLVGVAVPTVAVLLSPGLGAELAPRLDFLLTANAAVESQSVFGSQFGSVFGPVIAFGFGFFVGVPYLLFVAGRVARGDHLGWLPPVVSGAWFLVLTLLQVRFASELAPFLSLFAGVGVIHLAAVVDLTGVRPRVVSGDTATVTWRPSLPSRSTAASLLVLLLLVAGFGAVQTPVHVSKVTPEPTEVTTARWVHDYAEQNDLAYPDDYVLSQWGVNRLYNYHVNGESRSYRYAEAVHPQFLQSSPGSGWYGNLSRADRDGFVVTRDADMGGLPPQSLYATLHDRWGSASDTAPGASHYQAVHATTDGSIKVFQVVPGVTVTAPAPRSTKTPVSTNVSVADRRVEYRRSIESYRSGVVEVTLPYAGTYTVGNTTVWLSPDQVTTGDRIAAFDRSGATWAFENGSGRVAYETRGGHHAQIDRGRLRVGDGTGVVDLSPDGSVNAANVTLGVESTDQFRLTARFRTNESLLYRNGTRFPRIALHGEQTAFRKTDGYQLSIVDGRLRGYVGDGDRVVSLSGPSVDDAEWHTAALVWDGSRVLLVVDRRVVDTATWRGPVTTAGESVTIGRGLGGEIDYVRIRTANVTMPNTNEHAPLTTLITV